MNSKFFLFIILAGILINACKLTDNSILKFDPRTLKEKGITLSEIADDIAYIRLDNTYPLSNSSVKFTNNEICLTAPNIGILTFNKKGIFINRISSIGRGPGEYLMDFAFCIDDKTGTVYNLDGSVIKVYSRTGQFLRSFSLNEYVDNIQNLAFFNSKIFIQYGMMSPRSDFEWICYDTLGNIVKKQRRYFSRFSVDWGTMKYLSVFNHQLIYINDFADTIFSVLPDLEQKPSIIISHGEHRLSKSDFSFNQISSGKYLHLLKIFETNSYFIIQYFYYNTYLAIFNKHTRESFLIDLELDARKYHNGITNDLDGGHFFVPEEYYSENNREYMAELLYPDQIKTRVASDEFKNCNPKYLEKRKELEKLATSLKETDNPVLMLVRLKK